jgi:hypothetical protein
MRKPQENHKIFLRGQFEWRFCCPKADFNIITHTLNYIYNFNVKQNLIHNNFDDLFDVHDIVFMGFSAVILELGFNRCCPPMRHGLPGSPPTLPCHSHIPAVLVEAHTMALETRTIDQ